MIHTPWIYQLTIQLIISRGYLHFLIIIKISLPGHQMSINSITNSRLCHRVVCYQQFCVNNVVPVWQLHWFCDSSTVWKSTVGQLHFVTAPLCDSFIVWQLHCVTAPLHDISTAWKLHCMTDQMCDSSAVWQLHCVTDPLCDRFTVWQLHLFGTVIVRCYPLEAAH